jgi:hypothetical protein
MLSLCGLCAGYLGYGSGPGRLHRPISVIEYPLASPNLRTANLCELAISFHVCFRQTSMLTRQAIIGRCISMRGGKG